MRRGTRKPLGSGKGLPPASACYATQTDHRRQVEAADVRRLKHATDKARRRPDRRHTGGRPYAMGMTIGGVHYSDTQLEAIREVARLGRSRLGMFKSSTIRRLVACGMVEAFVPEATTLAMAERGRVRYYRPTAAGKEADVIIQRSRGRQDGFSASSEPHGEGGGA